MATPFLVFVVTLIAGTAILPTQTNHALSLVKEQYHLKEHIALVSVL
jgi:hypothetical protein